MGSAVITTVRQQKRFDKDKLVRLIMFRCAVFNPEPLDF